MIVRCCHGCLKIFEDRQKLVDHKRNSKIRNCQYKEHTKEHETIFQCDYKQCQQMFFEIGKLNKHKQRVHLRPFSCRFSKICNKTFGTKQRLLIHERIHENNKCEICKFCKKAFADPSTLRNHIFNIHVNEPMLNPFICRFCHKKFQSKSKLKSHLHVHLKKEERRTDTFRCTVCAKTFTTKSNCRRHIRKFHGNQ